MKWKNCCDGELCITFIIVPKSSCTQNDKYHICITVKFRILLDILNIFETRLEKIVPKSCSRMYRNCAIPNISLPYFRRYINYHYYITKLLCLNFIKHSIIVSKSPSTQIDRYQIYIMFEFKISVPLSTIFSNNSLKDCTKSRSTKFVLYPIFIIFWDTITASLSCVIPIL